MKSDFVMTPQKIHKIFIHTPKNINFSENTKEYWN